MKKILFIGKGSEKDPGFEGVTLDRIHYKDWMERKGIFVFESEIIQSCHGCPDLMNKYSAELESRAASGDRVVGIFSGGLYLALSSLQATQVTFPIISVPDDLVAYQAFMVPSGHAVVAGVGVDKEEIVSSQSKTNQKEKALMLAYKMLTLEDQEVCIIEDESKGKLEKKLLSLGINYKTGSYPHALHLSYSKSDQTNIYPYAQCLIRADSDANMNSWTYLRDSEERNHWHNLGQVLDSVPFAQVRGSDNLAIYAAKILSLQNPSLRRTLLEIKDAKRKSYNKHERHLSIELAD
ncbi:MAG: hypothetical protein ABIE22_05315 [archaeon]